MYTSYDIDDTKKHIYNYLNKFVKYDIINYNIVVF